MSYVIARKDGDRWLHFTGYVYPSGMPKVSESVSDAYHFASYDAALACTDTHECFRHSESWYVRKLREIGGKS